MTLSLLVFGRTGQVATELRRLASPDLAVESLGRDDADLSDPEACAARISETRADVVINAAAYTAVDRAENEPELAQAVNAAAPAAMARAAAARGLPILHVSTDYVFDGSSDRPWREDDPTAPLGAYGRSKLEGEYGVIKAGGPHVVLRTVWVFAAHGGNFVRTMLRVGRERAALHVVDDQRGGPTAAADIAATLVTIARAFRGGRGVSGVFHFSGTPATSWRGFAIGIFEEAQRLGLIERAPEVAPITSDQWLTPTPRPLNSALDGAKLAAAYGIRQPDWRPALRMVLKELKEKE